MISKVVYVSAKEAEDDVFQRELMNALIKMAAGSAGCNRTVNRKWKAVRDAIEAESREKDYLTKERYHALCAANGVEDENAPALLSYFNSLGVCFSCHRDEKKQKLAEYVKYLNAHGFDTEKPDYVENYFPAHSSCNRIKSNCTDPFALLAWHLRAARMAPTVLRLMEKRKRVE